MVESADGLVSIDPIALFACYSEEQQLFLSAGEFGKLLADTFPIARAKGEGRAFVLRHMTAADRDRDGRVGVVEWVRYWPVLAEHAQTLPEVGHCTSGPRPQVVGDYTFHGQMHPREEAVQDEQDDTAPRRGGKVTVGWW
jgi:hypothetical protein